MKIKSIGIKEGLRLWDGVGWVAYEILVSAQGPLVLGFGAKGLGPGPGLDNCSHLYIYISRYKEYY